MKNTELLDRIKDQVAQEYGYDNFKDWINYYNNVHGVVNKIAFRYAAAATAEKEASKEPEAKPIGSAVPDGYAHIQMKIWDYNKSYFEKFYMDGNKSAINETRPFWFTPPIEDTELVEAGLKYLEWNDNSDDEFPSDRHPTEIRFLKALSKYNTKP